MTMMRAGLGALAAVARAMEAALGPWLALAIRVWVAQAFLVGQVHEMMAGTAPHAAAWGWTLPDLMASDVGGIIRAVCPLLLMLGLFARPVAAAMLLQLWLMPLPGEAGLFCAALLLRIVAAGPGLVSVDGLLHRGADSLAVPGVALTRRFFKRADAALGPASLLGLRVWLAAAPAGAAFAALGVTSAMQPGLAGWLPHLPSMLSAIPPGPALALAGLLVLGACTRVVAKILLALVPLSHFAAGEALVYWALLLALLSIHGGGWLSVDRLIVLWQRRRTEPVDRGHLPHVVVVGGGFGGVAAVRGLRGAACRVTLVDQRNHHLFQPLLYQVATAGLSPGDIATPVRSMVRGQANVKVLLGRVTGVDPAGKRVVLGRGALDYDYLVLATGARHGYFGRDDWAPFAPGLKSVDDATDIRRRLLIGFEEAEGAADAAERAAWLTFVVVGGGPTGVELAGAIAELAHHGFTGEFSAIDPGTARVLLVQAGPRLLPSFPEGLSAEAARALRHLGVEVRLDSRVEAVGDTGVTVSGELIAARTVLWAAGVMASPAAAWLGSAADRAGRVTVGPDLSVPGRDGVFAIGDTAGSLGWQGKDVPGLAPAARQGGAYVARVIRARLRDARPPPPFRYRHLGSLATIGRQSAVADFGFVRVRGAFAWWLWGAAHILFLVGGRNRMSVLVEWLWAYLTFRRGTRLITGDAGSRGA